jgi:hypothetical protein
MIRNEVGKKGRLFMIRKIFLILFMGMILVAAATTSTSVPVLLAMGGLILFALFAATRREEQG